MHKKISSQDNHIIFKLKFLLSKIEQLVLENSCKPPSNLLDLIEKELKEFEGSFEHDEIVDIYKMLIFNHIFVFSNL
jgi:hypothetical protein